MSAPRPRRLFAISSVVDWFIPASMAADRDLRKQARMFLISHLFGPFLGNATLLAVATIDPPPNYRLLVFEISLSGFWIFPFLLRAGAPYNLLALLSIQNLIFSIFGGVYCYGGVASPLLPWVLTVPLLTLLYLNATPKLWAPALTLFLVNCVALWGAFALDLPVRLTSPPFAEMQRFGMASTALTAVYVAMMAIYYGKALASQSELEVEMRHHLDTAAELRRATEEAERASAAKADFLAGMSHELRTPLNAVIGYSQILLEDADAEGDEEAVADLHRIHGAGQQLLKLVNEVLDLSKIEAGKMGLSRGPVDVAHLIRDLAEEHRAVAREAGTRLEIEIEPDIGRADWDALRVGQALSQILENALRFARGGLVRIAARSASEEGAPMVRVSVSDTGPGIAPAALPTLFDQFTSEDDASATKYGGRGLGLALTSKLCRLMGGDVTVASALGQGSVFTLSLPRGRTEEALPPQEPEGEASAFDDRMADEEITRLRALLVAHSHPHHEKIA